MDEIIAIGPEVFTLGFELVGIRSKPENTLEKTLVQSDDLGIIIISQETYDKQSNRTQNIINTSIKPIILILSKEDTKGGHLRSAVIRALGIDVLKK